MEIEGKIIMDLPMQEGTSKAGNHWQKKEWVLETINTQYPRKVKFHVFGDRATQLNFEVGKNNALWRGSVECPHGVAAHVSVPAAVELAALQIEAHGIVLESREFNGRWYTDVSCYAMRALDGAAPQGAQPQTNQNFPPMPEGMQRGSSFGAAPAAKTPDFGGDDSDDLPF